MDSLLLPILYPHASKFVLENDRNEYIEFYKTAEKYAQTNGLILGGEIGVKILINQKITYDDVTTYEFYTDNTFDLAKGLADALFQVKTDGVVNSDFISLQTNIKYKEFTIYINARKLFVIRDIGRKKNVKLKHLIGATKVISPHGFDVLCMSAELQLIDIYRRLYDPQEAENWPRLLKYSEMLHKSIEGTLEDKVTKIKSKAIYEGGTNTKDKSKTKQNITQMILDKFVSNSDKVLVGDYAIDKSSAMEGYGRLQVISGDGIDNDMRKLKSILPNNELMYISHFLYLPQDFRIRKRTVYLVDGGNKQIAIMDIFNSAEFELIPYEKSVNNLIIGNPYVLLRYQLIDIWSLQLVLHLSSSVEKKIVSNLRQVEILIDKLKDIAYTKLFQLNNYKGVYEDIRVSKKKLTQKSRRIPNYYPYKNNKS